MRNKQEGRLRVYTYSIKEKNINKKFMRNLRKATYTESRAEQYYSGAGFINFAGAKCSFGAQLQNRW